MPEVKSIYNVPIKSWDGQEDFLSKYKGKVTLIVNVTANCGNAPQYEPLQQIHKKYKDQDFEVVAIPTNDYCGPGITYDEWEDGISCGNDARTYALDKYGVSYDFSELVTSKVHDYWREKRNNFSPTHELYEELTRSFPGDMGGNFEKFLVDREGKVVKRFHNSTLLDYYYENVEEGLTDVMENHEHPPLTKEEAYSLICEEIEKVL